MTEALAKAGGGGGFRTPDPRLMSSLGNVGLLGKPHELTLIFGSLLFVVGDFVPAFANIYGKLPFEIIDQII